MPATITVNTNLDTVALDGVCSIREAINSINTALDVNPDVTAAKIGAYGAADTVLFNALVVSPINLTAAAGANLAISKAMTITGPGSGALTIFNTAVASATSRIFNVTAAVNTSISGLTITGGNLSSGNGGAITNASTGNMTLTDMVITNNFTIGEGGGINNASTGALTLNLCVVSNNTAGPGAGLDGGGINCASTGVLTIDQSTISGNVAADDGGGIYQFSSAKIVITNSTISGNIARTGEGGGIYLFSTAVAGSIILNSTISCNASGLGGGGVAWRGAAGTFPIQNSTVTGNIAGAGNLNATGGGGLAIVSTVANFMLESTIVANNICPVGADVFASAAAVWTVNNSLIKVLHPNVALAGAGNLIGVDPLLSNLTFRGGPTQVHIPLPGSPVIDKGSNLAGLVTDQRGVGFPRVIGAQADMGAVESNLVVPFAYPPTWTPFNTCIPWTPSWPPPGFPTIGRPTRGGGEFANVNTIGGTTYTFRITYSDADGATGMDPLSFDGGDVTVTGPGGFNQPAAFLSAVGGPSNVVVTYQINAPGGTFDLADNGAYSVNINAGQVKTLGGNFVAAGTLDSFAVYVGKNIVVNSIADAGLGSLRQAILDSNASVLVPDTITFDTTVFGVAQTIALSGEMSITDLVCINGPGSKLLTIANTLAAGATSRIFNMQSLPFVQPVSMSGMTLIGGNTTSAGGAITMSDDFLNLTDMTFTGNKTNTTGGGAITGIGELATNLCSFTNNSTITNATADGGAIRGTTNSLIVLNNSTFSGNTSFDDGGAIYATGSSLAITGCTFTNNNAGNGAGTTADGGAIFLTGTIGVWGANLCNSTISGNIARVIGGGIAFASATGLFTVANTTMTLNSAQSATSQGAGIARTSSATLSVVSTIISGNSFTGGAPVANGVDLFAAAVTMNNSAIGTTAGFTPAGAGNQIGVPVVLVPLANNGGPTQTHLPGPGSPVRNAGSNPKNLIFDQRDSGFPRVLQGTADIGAVESVDPTPTAKGSAANVTVAGGTLHTITVIYTDDVGIDLLSLGSTDLVLNGPGGPLSVMFTGSTGGPLTVTATYTAVPPGGFWDAPDNGSWSITINANEVADVDGVTHFVTAGTAGTFTVNTPPQIPVGVGTSPNVIASGGTLQTVTVTYTDDLAIDFSTINATDLTINGPGGFSSPVNFVSVDVASNGTPRIGTYSFTPPGGSWDGPDNGAYTITMNATEVSDLDAPPKSVPAGSIGTFTVAAPFLFVVNTDINDEAVDTDTKTCLREAILAANAKVGTNDIITFDPVVFATAKTIALALGELAPSESVTIVAPAAPGARVTVDAGALSRIFNIGGGTLSVSNLTITNGSTAAGGGGIQVNANSVTLVNCTVSNNVSTSVTQGGGISTGGATGTWTLIDTTLSGNSGGRGGALYFFTSGTLRMSGCTVSGNSSSDVNGGGGLYNYTNSAVIINSTFHNNNSKGGAGGRIQMFNTGAVTLRNSTVTGNMALTSGGGINVASGTLTLVSTIVAENIAGTTGPDINGAVGAGALFNLIGKTDGSTGITDPSNKTGTIATPLSPNLDVLANNGGPTQTRAVLAGSPALNNGSANLTALTANATAGDTAITVASTGSFVPGAFLRIDSEVVAVTSIVSATVANVTRAQQGSIAAAHSSGAAAPLANDQRGATFNRVSGAAADIGAFEVQATPAKVSTVFINSLGANAAEKAQRSRVLDVAITFDSAVTFVGSPAAAFTLDKVGGGSVTFNATVSGGGTIVTLDNFGGTADFKSLADGRYALHALAAQFAGSGLDGDGNGIGGDDFIFDEPAAPTALNLARVFRIFGDFDGDGSVAAGDFIQFRLALGGTSPIFDFDNDGAVAANDFIQFRLRFGGSI